MAHQDEIQLHKNLGFLKEIFKKLIPDEVKDIEKHGNATLKSEWLAAVAIVCWGWTSPGDTLTKRFETACSVVGRIFGIETTATRQGLMNALAFATPVTGGSAIWLERDTRSGDLWRYR